MVRWEVVILTIAGQSGASEAKMCVSQLDEDIIFTDLDPALRTGVLDRRTFVSLDLPLWTANAARYHLGAFLEPRLCSHYALTW